MTGACRSRAVRTIRSGETGGTPIVLRGGLGDLPVLAELAPQRAAGGGERKGRRAGEEMVEGFLLDRVDVDGDRAAVDEAPQLAADVHPGAAAAALAGLDDAALGAQEALDDPRLVADPFPLQLFPGRHGTGGSRRRRGGRRSRSAPGGRDGPGRTSDRGRRGSRRRSPASRRSQRGEERHSPAPPRIGAIPASVFRKSRREIMALLSFRKIGFPAFSLKDGFYGSIGGPSGGVN